MSSIAHNPNLKPPTAHPLRENVAHLSALIHRDVAQSHRGALAAAFKGLIHPYLITDTASDQLLQIHRAAAPYGKLSPLVGTMSLEAFKKFMEIEGPVLQDRYLEFKARGHTGCAVVSEEATRRLCRIAPHGATTASTPDGLHWYTQVSIEGRDYWLDFTIDQFVAYAEIVAYTGYKISQRKLSRSSDYIGTLVMPALFD